jgi:SPP1 gp7 family putative phage head morphogenesis protein
MKRRKRPLVSNVLTDLTINPFVSEAQRRACYAADDPEWDCSEWESHTPKDKKLPERKKVHNDARRSVKLRLARRAGKLDSGALPSRIDPSRTLPEQNQMILRLRGQFALLKAAVVKFVGQEDSFGLKDRDHQMPDITRTEDVRVADLRQNFDPDQARGEDGRWEGGGGTATVEDSHEVMHVEVPGAGLIEVHRDPSEERLRNWLNSLKGPAWAKQLRAIVVGGHGYFWEPQSETGQEIYHNEIGSYALHQPMVPERLHAHAVIGKDGRAEVSADYRVSRELREWGEAHGITVNEFNPDQVRDARGRWATEGGPGSTEEEAQSVAAMTAIGRGVHDINFQREQSDRERGKIKAEIADRIGSRMDLPDEKVRAFLKDFPVPLDWDNIREPDVDDMKSGKLRSTAAARLIDQWAETSRDTNPLSIAVQKRAEDLFGIEGAYYPTAGRHGKNVGLSEAVVEADKISEKHGDVIDSYLKATYDHTQEELARAGVREMTLYRGMLHHGEPPMSGECRLQPLSSFSAVQRIAESFSGEGVRESGKPIVISSRVPASRIFSTCLTGPGAVPEAEVVALGGSMPCRVREPRPWADRHDVVQNVALYPDADDVSADWPKRTNDRRSAVANLNPYHDEHGRFSSASVGGTALAHKVGKQGGFTYRPLQGSSPHSGFVVSLPREAGWEKPISESKFRTKGKKIVLDYLKKVRDELKAGHLDPRTTHVGAWHDKKTHRVVLDVNEVYPTKREGVEVGRRRQQDAIYDIGSGQEIDLRVGGKRPTGNFNPHHDEAGRFASTDSVPPELAARKEATEKSSAAADRQLSEHRPEMMKKYMDVAGPDNPKHPGTFVLDPDDARELFGDYAASKESRSLLHSANSKHAREITSAATEAAMSAPVAPGHNPVVVMTAGGPGAGKSSGRGASRGISEAFAKAHAIEDVPIPEEKNIEEALKHGLNVHVVYTYRDPIEAFENGVLPRAMEQGRTVGIDSSARIWHEAKEAVRHIREKYRGDPRVAVSIIDNSHGLGGAKVVDDVPKEAEKYGTHTERLQRRLAVSLDRALRLGRISKSVYWGTVPLGGSGQAAGAFGGQRAQQTNAAWDRRDAHRPGVGRGPGGTGGEAARSPLRVNSNPHHDASGRFAKSDDPGQGVAFHGTTCKVLDKILKEGIQPQKEHNYDFTYYNRGEGLGGVGGSERNRSIYLLKTDKIPKTTDDLIHNERFDQAAYFADLAASVIRENTGKKTEPVVIIARIPKEAELKPDEVVSAFEGKGNAFRTTTGIGPRQIVGYVLPPKDRNLRGSKSFVMRDSLHRALELTLTGNVAGDVYFVPGAIILGDEVENYNPHHDSSGKFAKADEKTTPEEYEKSYPRTDPLDDPTDFTPPDREKFWHGTSTEAIDKIMEEGLKPRGGPGADSMARAFGMDVRHYEVSGRDASVYITTIPERAFQFAEYAASVTRSYPAVVKVAIPRDKLRNIKVDEFSDQPKDDPNAFRYEGSIPKEWIIGKATDSEEFDRLVRMAAHVIHYFIIPCTGGTAENAFCPTGEGGGQDNSCSRTSAAAEAHLQEINRLHGREAITRDRPEDPEFHTAERQRAEGLVDGLLADRKMDSLKTFHSDAGKSGDGITNIWSGGEHLATVYSSRSGVVVEGTRASMGRAKIAAGGADGDAAERIRKALRLRRMTSNVDAPQGGQHPHQPTVAIDFDGRIAEVHPKLDLEHTRPREGAASALAALRRAGIRVIVWTSRGDIDDVHTWLETWKIPYDEINQNSDYETGSRKIVADMYLDDRGEGDPDEPWPDLVKLVMRRLVSRDEEHEGPRQPTKSKRELFARAPEARGQLETMLSGLGIPVVEMADLPVGGLERALTEPGTVGLVPPIKGRERSEEKVNREYDGDWSRLLDIVRAAVACDSMGGLREISDRIDSDGNIEVERVKDRFAQPLDNGYRDLLYSIQLPCGIIAEIQLHLKPLLIARERQHTAYSVIRTIKGQMDKEGRRKMTSAERLAVRTVRNEGRELLARAWAECQVADPTLNAFCPTGEGGGRDNSCSPNLSFLSTERFEPSDVEGSTEEQIDHIASQIRQAVEDNPRRVLDPLFAARAKPGEQREQLETWLTLKGPITRPSGAGKISHSEYGIAAIHSHGDDPQPMNDEDIRLWLRDEVKASKGHVSRLVTYHNDGTAEILEITRRTNAKWLSRPNATADTVWERDPAGGYSRASMIGGLKKYAEKHGLAFKEFRWKDSPTDNELHRFQSTQLNVDDPEWRSHTLRLDSYEGQRPERGLHEFQSTHLEVGDEPILRRYALLQKYLRPQDVLEYEDNPHVTLRYGIHHGVTKDEVAAILRGYGRLNVILGGLRVFHGEKEDVLVVDAWAPQLQRMYDALGVLPNTETHPEYSPHMTVAYLRPGTGKKYIPYFDDILRGRKFGTITAVFSGRDESSEEITFNLNPNHDEMGRFAESPAVARVREDADKVEFSDRVLPERRWVERYGTMLPVITDLDEGKWYRDTAGSYQMTFRTSAGKEYEIHAKKEPDGEFEVDFIDNSDASFGITGTGRAHEVINRVLSSLTALMNREKPPAIEFSADEGSRRNLYDMLSRRMAGLVPDYSVVTSRLLGARYYTVVKRDKLSEKLRSLEGKKAEVLVNTSGYRNSDVPNWAQESGTKCGPAAVGAVARGKFRVGPAEQSDWAEVLDHTSEDGVNPQEIISVLRAVGLSVDAGQTTIADLDDSLDRGPVLCPIQDYGGGHWVVVLDLLRSGREITHVLCQDPAKDRNVDERDAGEEPGRVAIPVDEFEERWHDEDGDGRKYDHFGIAVGPPATENAFCPTGKGGGQDNSCSSRKRPSAKATEYMKELRKKGLKAWRLTNETCYKWVHTHRLAGIIEHGLREGQLSLNPDDWRWLSELSDHALLRMNARDLGEAVNSQKRGGASVVDIIDLGWTTVPKENWSPKKGYYVRQQRVRIWRQPVPAEKIEIQTENGWRPLNKEVLTKNKLDYWPEWQSLAGHPGTVEFDPITGWPTPITNYEGQPRDPDGKFASGEAGSGPHLDAVQKSFLAVAENYSKVEDWAKNEVKQHVREIAKSWVKDKNEESVSKIPKPIQLAVKAAYLAARGGLAVGTLAFKAAFSGWKINQALAERVAREQGMDEEQARRFRGAMSAFDLALFKPLAVMAAPSVVGSAAAWVVPPMTGAYLAYSTAKDPMVTARAARSLVLDAVHETKTDRFASAWSGIGQKIWHQYGEPALNAQVDVARQLSVALQRHNFSDWYIALLSMALDAGQGHAAIPLADHLAEHNPPPTANVFCPGGPGSGIDPSCSKSDENPHAEKPRAKKILEEAEKIPVTDVQTEPQEEVSWRDYNEIEYRMTVEERREMGERLEEDKKEAIDEVIRSSDFDISEREVAEAANLGAIDIESRAGEILNKYGVDTPDLKGREYGVDGVDRCIEEAEEWESETQHEKDELLEKLRGFRSDVEEEMQKAMDSAKEDAESRLREKLEDEYQSSASDRHNYLHDFYNDHVERYEEREAANCPESTWCRDENGDGILKFTTEGGRAYEVLAVQQDVAGIDIPDMQFRDDSDSFTITKAGHAFEVFSHVVPAMVAYVKKRDLQAATFSAAEPSRMRLYDRLVKSVTSVLPDYFAASVDKDEHRYYLIGKREERENLLGALKTKYRSITPNFIVNSTAYLIEEWWSPAGWSLACNSEWDDLQYNTTFADQPRDALDREHDRLLTDPEYGPAIRRIKEESGVLNKSFAEEIPERLLAALKRALSEVGGMVGPDYQRLFYNEKTRRAWWESSDGDDSNAVQTIKRCLESALSTSYAQGWDNVSVMSEKLPSQTEPGWFVLWERGGPVKRKWSVDPVRPSVRNASYEFHTDAKKLKAFQRWLKKQLTQYIEGKSQEDLWNAYVKQGFLKGAGRSFDEMKSHLQWQGAEGDFYSGSKQQFMETAFGQPVAVEKVKLLAGRTFDDLKGVTSQMSTKMSRVLSDGLVQGKNPKEVAKDMVGEIDISQKRAELIARTELIRAHAEGQLASFESLGIHEVGLMAEWMATPDSRVCEECAAMDGKLFKVAQAHGLIPMHPNCRCAWSSGVKI